MNRKKVVFIEPQGAFSNVFEKFMTIPMLGPVYLATIAKQAGYDVTILNENILGRHIRSSELESADVLCLSCMTPTVERGREIVKKYRALRRMSGEPSRAIIGGIHASMVPGDVTKDFDQVVVGEAEGVITDVLAGSISGKVVQGLRIEELDEIGIPDFTLIKGYEKIRIWPVMTSRGCLYQCNFCSVTEMFGRDYRTRSVDNVMNEIMRYKRGSLFFTDDHFVASPKRTDQLLDAMIAAKFNRPWSAQMRTEVSKKPELVAKLKKAGCEVVYVGFESINPESLKGMKKGQKVADIERSIRVFHDHGILVHGMFMLGNDSDTPRIFKSTSAFCKSSGLDFVQYTVLTPLPGTALYTQLEGENRLLHKDWQYYDTLHAVFRPRHIIPDELQKGMIRCYRDFYSYRAVIWSAILTFFRLIRAGIRKTYSQAHLPRLYPILIKFYGRSILQRWIRYNRSYLDYLRRNGGAWNPADTEQKPAEVSSMTA